MPRRSRNWWIQYLVAFVVIIVVLALVQSC